MIASRKPFQMAAPKISEGVANRRADAPRLRPVHTITHAKATTEKQPARAPAPLPLCASRAAATKIIPRLKVPATARAYAHPTSTMRLEDTRPAGLVAQVGHRWISPGKV